MKKKGLLLINKINKSKYNNDKKKKRYKVPIEINKCGDIRKERVRLAKSNSAQKIEFFASNESKNDIVFEGSSVSKVAEYFQKSRDSRRVIVAARAEHNSIIMRRN